MDWRVVRNSIGWMEGISVTTWSWCEGQHIPWVTFHWLKIFKNHRQDPLRKSHCCRCSQVLPGASEGNCISPVHSGIWPLNLTQSIWNSFIPFWQTPHDNIIILQFWMWKVPRLSLLIITVVLGTIKIEPHILFYYSIVMYLSKPLNWSNRSTGIQKRKCIKPEIRQCVEEKDMNLLESHPNICEFSTLQKHLWLPMKPSNNGTKLVKCICVFAIHQSVSTTPENRLIKPKIFDGKDVWWCVSQRIAGETWVSWDRKSTQSFSLY